MKDFFRNIGYSLLYALLFLLALLPLPILYIVSDVLYIIVYYVIKYRRKVVRENMQKVYPDMLQKERLSLERNFYKHFTDYMVETIKLLHISDKEMRRRMEFVDADVVDRYTTQGRSVMLLLGHYGNWEWIPSLTMWCAQPQGIQAGQIYRPLRNKWFDQFFIRLRGRFGTQCIAKNDTFRNLLKCKREGRVSLTGFIADQTPSPRNIHHWVDFLGRSTPVLTGFETIARKLDMAVVYIDVEVVKRGYYRATFRLLEDNPAACPEFDITNRYNAAMEQTIRRAPHAWLWTHKRWKWEHIR
ncbi:MAG: lysophospholipid acyltransferase family protein [Bacteroidaceae bacterium]|nr:lysophospholipid acyltransferase family protein [Bacteroidaceae bacterium]